MVRLSLLFSILLCLAAYAVTFTGGTFTGGKLNIVEESVVAYFVDYTDGNDNNAGTSRSAWDIGCYEEY